LLKRGGVLASKCERALNSTISCPKGKGGTLSAGGWGEKGKGKKAKRKN